MIEGVMRREIMEKGVESEEVVRVEMMKSERNIMFGKQMSGMIREKMIER